MHFCCSSFHSHALDTLSAPHVGLPTGYNITILNGYSVRGLITCTIRCLFTPHTQPSPLSLSLLHRLRPFASGRVGSGQRRGAAGGVVALNSALAVGGLHRSRDFRGAQVLAGRGWQGVHENSHF